MDSKVKQELLELFKNTHRDLAINIVKSREQSNTKLKNELLEELSTSNNRQTSNNLSIYTSIVVTIILIILILLLSGLITLYNPKQEKDLYKVEVHSDKIVKYYKK